MFGIKLAQIHRCKQSNAEVSGSRKGVTGLKTSAAGYCGIIQRYYLYFSVVKISDIYTTFCSFTVLLLYGLL